MGTSTRGRVVVVSHNNARTIGSCLDALAAQCDDEIEVVVVDQDSSDASADVAIHHSLPDQVTLAAAGSFQHVLKAASREAKRLVLLRADSDPCPGWVDAALDGLERAALVTGPDHQIGNLAIDLARLGTVRLFDGSGGIDVVLQRARRAGAQIAVARGMTVAPARPAVTPRDPAADPLPVRRGPPVGAPRYAGLVSVVLCTKGRPAQLARCLQSLTRLADADHEVLVVDNHAVPTVDAAVVPTRGRVIHEPRRGLDAARNRGLAEAAGDVVAYIDDDCEADPHWITALRVAFADTDVGMVTGRVRPASLARPTQRYFEAYFSFDRGTTRRRFTPWDDRPWFPLWTGPMGTGCNMAFRRDVLVDVHGFDELLDVGTSIGGGGDLDIYARLIDRGVIAEYAPDALVWHHHRADRGELTAQFHGYGVATGAYLMKAVLERPGLRFAAVRFYCERMTSRVRVARDIRAGIHVLPMSLLLTALWGQIVGPLWYLRARAARRR